MSKLRLESFQNCLSRRNRLGRALWVVVNFLLVRPAFPRPLWFWRRFWFRLFGAKLNNKSLIRSGAWVWAPWNLEMGAYSCLASGAKIYNAGKISIGNQVTISQGAYLCPVSHDISSPTFPMICSEMTIEDQVWIATDAFVGGRDIRIGEGAVVAARAVVFENVEPWAVVSGNPAKCIKKRVIKDEK